jgi:transposase
MSMSRVVITAVVLEGRSKSAVARDYGVSRRWVQILVARYLAEGEAAFGPRSHRPHASPQRTSQATEDAIVALRKELAEAGHDAGAETIAWHLRQQAGCSPSVATIWRILSRRGFVTPQPHKRPRSSWRRFRRPGGLSRHANAGRLPATAAEGQARTNMNHGQHKDGTPITDADIQAMADAAERGYEVDTLLRRRRGGRPPLGSARRRRRVRPADLRRTTPNPAATRLPSGQASDVLAWHDAVRPIRSLRPERVHSCHQTEIVPS